MTSLTDRELDRAIAELLGVSAGNATCGPQGCGIESHWLPHYTTDPAWTVAFLEEMRAAGMTALMFDDEDIEKPVGLIVAEAWMHAKVPTEAWAVTPGTTWPPESLK